MEDQVAKLKYFIRYCGLTFEDIIFELKRQIYENNVVEYSDEEDDPTESLGQQQEGGLGAASSSATMRSGGSNDTASNTA